MYLREQYPHIRVYTYLFGYVQQRTMLQGNYRVVQRRSGAKQTYSQQKRPTTNRISCLALTKGLYKYACFANTTLLSLCANGKSICTRVVLAVGWDGLDIMCAPTSATYALLGGIELSA